MILKFDYKAFDGTISAWLNYKQI